MNIEENRIEIVPLGINLKDYMNLPKKGSFKIKYNIKDNDKLLLFLGRIHKIKGLDLLIESLNNINNNNIKLAIVGGDYGFKNEIEKLINEYNLNDNVIFPGVLTGTEKIECLVDCDIFIMPSRYESFTTSGLEAMASSKPLILTKNNHIHTWANNTVGLCCDFDKNELSKCIETLLSNKELCEEFGENGRKLIENKYNWNNIKIQIENIYKSCF